MTRVLIRRPPMDTEIHRENVRDEGRDWSDVSINQGKLRIGGNQPTPGRGEKTLPVEPFIRGSVAFPAPWLWTSGL